MTTQSLAAPAQFGANFQLTVKDDSPSWTPLTSLLTPEVLAERVENTREAIGGVGTSAREIRAVASTMALGLFSRLLSPVLGAAVLHVPTLQPSLETTWLKPVPRGTIPLATSASPVEPDPQAAIEGLILPLIPAMSVAYKLSTTVLLGNAAAAVAGACGVITGTHPELSKDAAAWRATLLTTPPLIGTGTPTGKFVRASCCLIWQLPMHYICSNCILVNHDTHMIRERDDDVAGSAGFQARFKEQLDEAKRTHTFRGITAQRAD